MSSEALVWGSFAVVAMSLVIQPTARVGRPIPHGTSSSGGERRQWFVTRRPRSSAQLLAVIALALAIMVSPLIGAALPIGTLVVVRSKTRVEHRRLARRVQEWVPQVLLETARLMRVGTSAPLALAQALSPPDADLQRLAIQARGALTRGEPLYVAVDLWHRDVSTVLGPSILDDLLPAIALSHQVGGITASAVESVAEMAGEREALLHEQRAQASQARASALVMTIAPLVFCAQMVLRDPSASRLLLRTPVGWVLIGIGGGLDVAAWWWIRRLTSPRARSRTAAPTVSPLQAPRVLLGLPVRSPLRRMMLGTPARRLPPSVGPSNPVNRIASGGPIIGIGTLVERALASASRRGTSKAVVDAVFGSPSPERTRRLGIAAAVLPALWLVRPTLGVVATVVLIAGPRGAARLELRRTAQLRRREVPQVVELLRLAIESGATPTLALIGVASVAGPGLRPTLEKLRDDLRQGVPVDAALRQAAARSPELRALSDVLVAGSRLGLSVGETLRGLSVEARNARRREAEAQARRLPVVLLFPVVCLTLPAFVVLTVVPLLLTGLGALRF